MNGNFTYWYSKKGEIYYLICHKTFSQVTKTLRHYNQYLSISNMAANVPFMTAQG